MIEPSIEELVDSYNKATATLEELEAQKEVVRDAILKYLKERRLDGLKTKSGYNVRRVFSTNFTQVPLSFARELGATKTEEKINTEKLKKIQQSGIEIKGAKITVRLLVKGTDE